MNIANDELINLLFVGDLYNGNYIDKNFISERLRNYIALHDVKSCNFEGPEMDNDLKPIEKLGPSLKQSKGTINFLQDMGFNLFNLANNHILDFGSYGLSETKQKLKDSHFLGAGHNYEEAYKPIIVRIKGRKIGFLSFAEWGFGALDKYHKKGFAWIHDDNRNNYINNLRSKVDFLVIQVHAGTENIYYPLPEWRKIYRSLIDYGADIVIGHHPHVPQGWEEYKGKMIFYSLGNFFFSNKSFKSYIVSLYLNPNNLKLDYKILPIIQKNEIVDLFESQQYRTFLAEIKSNLESPKYEKQIESLVFFLWENTYKPFYYHSFNGFHIVKNPYKIIKSLYNLFFRKKRKKELMFFHNIKIESHRYVMWNFIEMMNKYKVNYE